MTASGTLEFVAGGGGGSGQGGQAIGFLQSGGTYYPRPGSGGAGGGGVNRPEGTFDGTSKGFDGEGVSGTWGKYSGADGATVTGPGAGGEAGLTWSNQSPAPNGTVSATASAGHHGGGPANSGAFGTGGEGAGAAKACAVDQPGLPTYFSEGGGGGGGYFGGGGGGCGWAGGGGGGGGSSFVASDVTSPSFANLINPPVADNQPTLGGHYSNVISGLASISFAVCSDSSTSDSSNVRSNAESAHTSGGSCPLTVTVKQLETPRSGLAVHGAHYNVFPVDFVDSNNSSGSIGFRCQSGCTDLLVKVVNPKTNKAVVGAKVNASIGAISGLTGNGFLCGEEVDGKTDTSTCGQYVSGLVTNSDGQVYIRYWLPGVVKAASSTLNVTAKKKCDAQSCSSKELEGSADPTTVTVKPYLIYQKTASLSEAQVEDVGAWAGGTRLFTKFLKVTSNGPKVLTYSLKWLKAFVTSSEKVVEGLEVLEKVEPIAGAFEVLQTFTELWERESMIAMFLQVMNLSPIGIGDPPSEASAPSSASTSFSNKIVNYGVAVPFDIGADGAWWGVAQQLSKTHDDYKGYGLVLKVYEVSTCQQGKDCEPGYANDPGEANVLREGIDPELAFYLTLTYQGYNFGSYNFMLPYDAIAWTETQPNLKGVINDFK